MVTSPERKPVRAALLCVVTCGFVLAAVSLVIPVGKITVANDSGTTIHELEITSRCATRHVAQLADGDTTSLWFWSCGETGGAVSFAAPNGDVDEVSGGYLDPPFLGAITLRIREDRSEVERGLLLTPPGW